MHKKSPFFVYASLSIVIFIFLLPLASSQSCTPSGPEIPYNSIDENCDGWIDSGLGYQLRSQHPRSLVTIEELNAALNRSYGPYARDPYATWFQRIQNQEERCHENPSSSCPQSLIDLALLYKATGDSKYRDWYLNLLNHTLSSRTPGDYSGGGIEEAFSMDVMWNEIPDDLKLRAYELASPMNAYYWHSGANAQEQNFAYHGAAGRDAELIFSVTYAFDPILQNPEVFSHPDIYSLNVSLFIKTLMEELYPGGLFHDVERRIAGDPTYNPVLQGDYGGMYDNFGYDRSEESHSIYLISTFQTATGQNIMDDFLHDKYRGRFYQMMGNPSMTRYSGSGENLHKFRTMVRIWFTQTDASSPARNAVALTASKYNDPHMQYWANVWRKEYNTHDYTYYVNALWWFILFYNDSLPEAPLESNPPSMYFNGPGLVSMRSDWGDNATFAVFMCGEGISRRYEDGNSFIIYRKGPVFINSGARIRRNEDNDKHQWYNLHSIARNTMKIFDPDERFDVDRNNNGQRTDLHTGQYALVPSDNMGGMISETYISTEDKKYVTWRGIARGCYDQRRGECEAGNMLKYEFVPGEYTYSVGDATEAYTKKIDYFIREFLYLQPDTFVVFDRVKSVNPNFKKVWVAHTVDEPVVQDEIYNTSNGMKSYIDSNLTIMDNLRTTTYIHTLLPKENKIVVRGGDTILTDSPLRPGVPITESQINESDIPRWLELFAIGPDTRGSVTITGDAREGNGVSETVTFDGNYQEYDGGYFTHIESGLLIDNTRLWRDNQWKNYYLHVRGGTNGDYLITGNNRTALFTESFDPSGVWGYQIRRPLANSEYHWKRITSITTNDMDLDHFIVSTPHYFDAEDVLGRLETFAPKTDGRDDTKKRPDIGQWTFNVEARVPRMHDNFLNVFYLTDSGNPDIDVETIDAANGTGVLLNKTFFVLFSNLPENLTQTQYTINTTGLLKNLILDLKPLTTYNVYEDGQKILTLVSSSMGTLYFNITFHSQHTITLSETEPQDCESIGGVCMEKQCSSYNDCNSLVGLCDSGYCCRGECSACMNGADTDCDGRITLLELLPFINKWKQNQITIRELIDAIRIWKGGS